MTNFHSYRFKDEICTLVLEVFEEGVKIGEILELHCEAQKFIVKRTLGRIVVAESRIIMRLFEHYI